MSRDEEMAGKKNRFNNKVEIMIKKYLLISVLIVGVFSSFVWCEPVKDSHFEQGNSYLREGRYEEAISEYKKAIRIAPNNASLYYNLGFTYNKLGQYQQAVKYFNKAIGINPDDFDAYTELGFAYDQLGKYPEAIKYYEKALQIKPNDAMTYYNIGVAYNSLKKHQEAIKYYEKALQIDPKYDSAYNNIGFAYTQLGQHEKAIGYYEKVLRTNPNDDYAYNNIGFAHSELGQHQEAIKYYQKAIQINPNYIAAYNNLSVAYSKLGLRQKAEESYEVAKELSVMYASPNHMLIKDFSERIRGNLGLSILPPQEKGWFAVKDPQVGGMNFKKIDNLAHTFGCHFFVYTADNDFKNPDEFLEWLKENQLRDTDPKRFKDIKYRYNLNKRYGSYCVEYEVKTTDIKRKAKDGTCLVLKMYGFAFRHPKSPQYVVDIRYSERGVDKDFTPSFQKVGDEFINSLIIE